MHDANGDQSSRDGNAASRVLCGSWSDHGTCGEAPGLRAR